MTIGLDLLAPCPTREELVFQLEQAQQRLNESDSFAEEQMSQNFLQRAETRLRFFDEGKFLEGFKQGQGSPWGLHNCAGNMTGLSDSCYSVEKAEEGRMLACTMEMNPVCGCDGKTYSNACSAEVRGLLSYKEGACNAPANPTNKPYPNVGIASNVRGNKYMGRPDFGVVPPPLIETEPQKMGFDTNTALLVIGVGLLAIIALKK